MEIEVKLTVDAENDLMNIKEYLINYGEAFNKLLNKINACIKIIKYNPEIGRIGRRHNTREFFINNTDYIIVYKCKQNLLEILTILHTSKKY
ncbi:MAG: type II toxin-antitoxin system RelE/ParE family toxin [Alphaproteobacteria bacterium]|jgi:addiction module RelE/StbE family toxin|nr:type II toxin-antitoxin system RelE/ParE family toxin [Alphaproteobacteria bacterium]